MPGQAVGGLLGAYVTVNIADKVVRSTSLLNRKKKKKKKGSLLN